jgi:hypothetical protein
MMPLLLKTDRAGLRAFGWQMSIAVLLIFMLLLPWLFGSLVNGGLPLWPGGISAILLLLAWFYPLGLYYPYRAWMAFATVMAWFNTRLLLGLVFYLMLLPMGLVLRLLSKLQYNRKTTADSYWLAPDKIPTAKDLEDPF